MTSQHTIITTELCVDSIESLVKAHSIFLKTLIMENNATRTSPQRTLRFELCSALHQGGLTPSMGFVQSAIETLSKSYASSSSLSSLYKIELFIMIRSRPGLDFCYSYEEMEVMLKDIEILGKLFSSATTAANNGVKIRGIVFGALKRQQQQTTDDKMKITKAIGLDKEALNSVCESAKKHNWSVTFHRAIDYLGEDARPLSKDDNQGSSLYFDILTDIANNFDQVEFVLSSGGTTHSTSQDEASVVDDLIEKFTKFTGVKRNLKIILGGGVNVKVVEKIEQRFQQVSSLMMNPSSICIYGLHFSGKKVILPSAGVVPECESYWALNEKVVEELFVKTMMLLKPIVNKSSNSHV